MAHLTLDAGGFKAEQRVEWDRFAPAWGAWWATLARSGRAVTDRLIAGAGLGPGMRVLDLATGLGEPACSAAAVVGAAGYVVAIDQAPGMLALARERAASLGLTNVEFRELDAERTDLLDDRFDAALCRWGLMFLPELVPALARLRARLVPGGRFAAAVWSTPPRVPLLSFPLVVLSRYIPVPPAPAGVPGVFSLADPPVLAQACRQAGFTDVQTELLTVVDEFPSADAYTHFIRAVSPVVDAVVGRESLTQQDRLWAAIAEAVRERFGAADGSVRLSNETICLVARNDTGT